MILEYAFPNCDESRYFEFMYNTGMSQTPLIQNYGIYRRLLPVLELIYNLNTYSLV